MDLLRFALLDIFVGLFLSAAAAQTTQPQAVPPPSAAQSVSASASMSPAHSTVLHANANLVLVDVVVTDKGNAVHGLDRGRFHILENGKEQTITSFDEHRLSAAPAAQAAAQASPLPPNTYTNVPTYPETSVVNVLLLDGLNTPMPDQQYARLQIVQFMKQVRPGTPMAIFTLSSRLRMVAGFTTDVPSLAKLLESRKANPQQSVVLDPRNGELTDSSVGATTEAMALSSSSDATADAIGALEQFEADLETFQTDLRVRMTLDAMDELARYLSAIPGRKNLIWFSGSFPLALNPDDTLSSPFRDLRNYADDIQKTSDLLSAARVAVYPVDARGLMTMPTANASFVPSTNRASIGPGRRGVAMRSNGAMLANANTRFLNATLQEHGAMRAMAEETGGKAFYDSNGLKEAVASAIDNGSSYYTIGYVPAETNFDGRFHKIKVRMDHARYNLSYRRGYYADPAGKPSANNPGAPSLMKEAVLHGAPESTQVQFAARILPASDPLYSNLKFPDAPAGELAAKLKHPHRYVAELAVDTRGLGFHELTTHVHQALLEFVLVAYDAEGDRVNDEDTSFAINIKPEQYESTKTTSVRARLTLDLPPGQDYLRVAVQDLVAGHVGALEVPVTVTSK